MKLYILPAIILLSVAGISAQEKLVTAEPVFLSLAQPTTKKLPLPEYPKDAQKAGLGGRVSVAVTVDASGNVISADDATGPYPVCNTVTEPKVLALRAAAIEAAKKATFQPAIGDQGPVKATGRIAYVFTSGVAGSSGMAGIAIGNADSDSGDRVDPGRDSNNGKQVRLMRVDPNGKPIPDAARAIGSAESKNVSGGVLNGKATSLPKPIYPAAAKAVRAGGAVSVQVLIFEDGSMYSAQAVSGHPLLRHAAEIAACSAGFTPTLLEGNPVKVLGVITYNFVP